MPWILRGVIAAFAALILVSCGSTSGPSAQTLARASALQAQDTARTDRLNAYLAKLQAEGVMPGASVLVYDHGHESFFGEFGYQDKENQIALDRHTIGRFYSMSKPITGVGLMMLYEEGMFDLDDPVATYLPEFAHMKVYAGTKEDGQPIFKDAARPITIRDLMRHTAGMTYGFFGDTPVDKLYRHDNILSYEVANGPMSKAVAAEPLLYQPATRWHYSVAADIQGRLIEVLSGQSLGNFLQARIFKPLGMTDTGFTVRPGQQARFGALYQLKKDGLHRLEDDPPFLANQPFLTDMALQSGGGGLVSTIDDYMRFARMLLGRGELDGVRLLKPETLALMTSDQLKGLDHSELPKGDTFGLDFAVRTAGPGARYAPGSFFWGGLAGTFFFVDPKNDLTVVLFDQVIGADAIKLRPRLADAIYGPLPQNQQ